MGFNNDGGDSYFYNNTCFKVKNTSELSANIKELHNNIFSQNSMNASGSVARENNLYLDEVDPNNIFVDYPNYNFRLKAGSPAINGGVWRHYMSVEYNKDIIGNNVPQNDNIDIGAIQYIL